MTPIEAEFLAFVNHVIGETNRIVIKAGTGKAEEARSLAGMLCDVAGKKRRELLGMEEPDPEVDYDPDCHWDGTERLPGEPRRDKGDAFSDTLDLSAITQESLASGCPHCAAGFEPINGWHPIGVSGIGTGQCSNFREKE